ncbi:MAG: hypothetical protein R3B70_00630 [Polyangiaceae bacterium]
MGARAGFDADKEAAAPWMGAAGRVAGRLTLAGPLWMLAGVEGLVPVLVPRVEVRSIQGQPVADVSVPSVGLGLFLGLGVTFP